MCFGLCEASDESVPTEQGSRALARSTSGWGEVVYLAARHGTGTKNTRFRRKVRPAGDVSFRDVV